jgi:FMN reductase [NAD(P)H]
VEFRELLPRRRMVRHYRPEPVPRDVLERIVATIRRAPSAGYSQGQRLLVLTEPKARSVVARTMREGARAAARDPVPSRRWRLRGRRSRSRTADELEPWLESAPVHLLVCTREADYHERYQQPDKLHEGREIDWPVPFWYVDAGAALMLVLLAALDEGLAAGVCGVPRPCAEALREAFGIPGDVTIVALVTIGYPAPDPAWSAVTSRRTQPRRAPDETVRWERW